MNKQFIILGAGRSGISLTSGLIDYPGIFRGPGVYEGNNSNPLGFFESPLINRLNEQLLLPYLRQRYGILDNILFSTPILKNLIPKIPLRQNRVIRNQIWLASISPEITINSNNYNYEINTLCTASNFCYKDPRFSYTLPIWQNYLPLNTKFIVVFRHPQKTLYSISNEIKTAPYLKNKLLLGSAYLQTMWINIYGHILKTYTKSQFKKKWLFISYESIIQGNSLKRLEQFCQIPLRNNLINPTLNRSYANSLYNTEILSLYNYLKSLENI